MDVALFLRAIGRHKLVFFTGLFAACALAFLATAKVSFAGGSPKVTYRSPIVYSATTRVVVTQVGFPWGLAVLPQSGPNATAYGDPTRFSTLASFYATLANSDTIQSRLNLDRREMETLVAAAVTDPNGSGATLPFVDITGYGITPRSAVEVSVRGAKALHAYVDHEQQQAKLPMRQRAVVQIIQVPNKVGIALKRKKTMTIVVFMTVMLATIGVILVLENIARSRMLREAEAERRGEVTDVGPALEARHAEARAGRGVA